MTAIIFFALLMTGNVFGIAVLKKNKIEYIAITALSIILALYLGGIFDILHHSVYLICIICFLLYVVSIVNIFRKKTIKTFIHEFISFPIVWIIGVFVLVYIGDHGRLVQAYDDVDHWAIAVKELCRNGGFSTNTNDFAPSYPPSMALMQYFVQKLYRFINSTNEFSEWLLFYTYKVMTYILMLPLINIIGKEKKYRKIKALIIFFLPTIIFKNLFLNTIYIDIFLSTLCSFATYMIINKTVSSKCRYIVFVESIAVLVLTKDIGLIFAFCLSILFIVIELIDLNKGEERIHIKNGFMLAIPLITIIIVKFSWSTKLNLLGISATSNSVSSMLKVINISDTETFRESYHYQTFVNYCHAFLGGEKFKLSNFNISFSYYVLFLLILITVISLISRISDEINKKRLLIWFSGISITVITYCAAQCFLYMFYFSEGQAIGLTSFERYHNIAFYWFLLMAIYVMVYIDNKIESRYECKIILCSLILIMPLNLWFSFFCGETTRASITIRNNYTEDISILKQAEEKTGKVYMVNLDTDPLSCGLDFFTIFFIFNDLDKLDNHSNGIVKEGNMEEWMDTLVKEYTYVYIRKIDDSFIETYGELFYSLPNVGEKNLYRVDKQQRKLVEM